MAINDMQNLRFDNMQNDLIHWGAIQASFGESRLPGQMGYAIPPLGLPLCLRSYM